MLMSPPLRKFALLIHVITSVGWFGAVAAFLALALAGLISPDVQQVQSAYLAMGLITSAVIVPLSLASLLTGLVSSFGTEWGLFRYYWVLLKLILTVVSTFILLVHTQPISLLALAAAKGTVFSSDLHGLQIQMLYASGAALLVLVVLTALSVYKPKGLTPYGWRKQQARRTASPA